MPRLPGLLWLALALAPLGCTSPEDCTNEVDDDGDGLIDCDDCDCDGVCESEPCDGDCEEVCGDGADNDEDGATDCEDSDCDGDCPEDCDDGRDNDGDGLTDCADAACDGTEHGCPEVCDDHRDNDGDGALDCDDPDCDGSGSGCPEDCSDTRDNDGDGAADCADDDCDGLEHGCDEDCGDARDNDGDGATDCADVDCDGECAEVCDDGRDNDLDGRIDCEDGDCAAAVWCYESDCDDGSDQDADGLVDCDDADCWGHGCGATIAQVKGGIGTAYRGVLEKHMRKWSVGSTPSLRESGTYIGSFSTMGALSITGSVQVVSSSGAWTTCSWTRPWRGLVFMHFEQHYHIGDFDLYATMAYSPTATAVLSTGCPLTSTDFHPDELVPRFPWLYLPGGGPWYHGTGTTTSTLSSSFTATTAGPYRYTSTDGFIQVTYLNIPTLLTGDTWWFPH